ncbi:MAG: L,D-transpeptidase family protein [Flectobacillus sp.]
MRALFYLQKLFTFCFIIGTVWSTPVVAQTQEDLKSFIQKLYSDQAYAKELQIESPSEVIRFYQNIDYKTIWLEGESDYKKEYLDVLKHASDYGLDRTKYHYGYLTSRHFPTLEYELIMTHSIMEFYKDIANGTTLLDLSYNGLGYNNHCLNPTAMLLNTYAKGSVKDVISFLQPQSLGYQATQNLLTRLNTFVENDNFQEPVVTYIATFAENKELIKKLYYLGFLPTMTDASLLKEGMITNALKGFQSLYNIVPDGILGPITLSKLSIPLVKLRAQLILNLNRWRVINCLDNQRYIQINIPSATLALYDRDSLVMRMKTIVGKPITPTPTLCSEINKITFFPYYEVPKNVAINELLPVQQKEPSFFENNGYQLIDEKGFVRDANSIDWGTVSKDNFPYEVRQVAGCDNSLGLLKFDFDSPYSMYLHDTNRKDLFSKNKRYLSNACIRLEKPYELATMLFQDRNLVEEFVKKRFEPHLSPTSFALENPIKIFITYITADVDDFGSLVIYDDVYNKDNIK